MEENRQRHKDGGVGGRRSWYGRAMIKHIVALAVLVAGMGCSGAAGPAGDSKTPDGENSAASKPGNGADAAEGAEDAAAGQDAAGETQGPGASAAAEPELTEAEIQALMQKWGALMGKAMPAQTYAEADADERWFFRSCFDFFAPMQRAMQEARAQSQGPLDIHALVPRMVKEAMSARGKVPPETVQRCADFMLRGVRAYLLSVRLIKPAVTLRTIGSAMARVYDEKKKLCPATTKPAPARWDAAKRRFVAGPGEYESPAWQCLLFDPGPGEHQFQYEIRVDPAKQSFVATAVGSVTEDDRKQQLRITGRVQGDALIVEEVEKPSGKELVIEGEKRRSPFGR